MKIKFEVQDVGDGRFALTGQFEGFDIAVGVAPLRPPVICISKGERSLSIQKKHRNAVATRGYVPLTETEDNWNAYDVLPDKVFRFAVDLGEVISGDAIMARNVPAFEMRM